MLVAALLVGCTSTPTDAGRAQGGAGPLAVPQQPATVCGSVDSGGRGRVTFGVTQLNNTENGLATIVAVKAGTATNANVEGFLLVPNRGTVDGSAGIGAVSGFPPTDLPDGMTEDWSKAVPAMGAVVPAGHLADLVMGVGRRAVSKDAVVRGVTLEYTLENVRYTVVVPISFVVGGRC